MNFAEVSVTFDNSDRLMEYDSDEVIVTRRYLRRGESEYFINRRPVRLREIHELFMNTGVGREGYSIIGQGRIAEIISQRSEDRRAIFEEAAGISKYRYKKEEAEDKLASVDENLTRLNDIMSELEGRVGPLEKESERAKRYLEYYEIKKRDDIALWLHDSDKLADELKAANDRLTLAKTELTSRPRRSRPSRIRTNGFLRRLRNQSINTKSSRVRLTPSRSASTSLTAQ